VQQGRLLFDERDVAQLVSKVLVDSKVLVNNNKAIGAQTKEAMGKLAGGTAAIYRGSKYAQTSGVHMMKASKNSGPFASSDFKHSKCQVGQHLLATSKKGEKVVFFRETKVVPRNLVVHPEGDKFDYIDSNTVLNEVLLNAWRYDEKYDEGSFFSGYYQCKTTWLWPAKDATEHLDLNLTYRGSLRDIEKNYRKLRSQYLVS